MRCVFVMALILLLVPAPEVAIADSDDGRNEKRGFCTATAKAVFEACGHDVRSDYAIARAICINVSDDAERAQCLAEARTAKREGNQLCRDQLAGRREACEALGEERYDPPFEPADFDSDFRHLTSPNPYFPLGIGYRWEYRGGNEFNVVEVLDQTKLIDGRELHRLERPGVRER